MLHLSELISCLDDLATRSELLCLLLLLLLEVMLSLVEPHLAPYVGVSQIYHNPTTDNKIGLTITT